MNKTKLFIVQNIHQTMIYKIKPKDFHPKLEVVSCFVESQEKILLLHRQDYKPQGNTWGAPAGKVDLGQTPLEAMVRELQEETGLEIPETEFSYKGKVYVRYPDFDFIYHTYHLKLSEQVDIQLRLKEHKDFRWIKPEDALEKLELIPDFDKNIKEFYNL